MPIGQPPTQRTSLFKQMPWIGGLNTSLDPGMISPNQCTVADHVIYGVRGSKLKREGISYNWDTATTGTASVIGQLDFWFGTTGRTQKRVAVWDDKTIHSYSGGTHAALTVNGTSWGSAITQACLLTFNNLALIAVDGSSNVMKKWSGSGAADDLGVHRTTGNIATDTTLANVADITALYVGATVTGTGIPANTKIVSISGLNSCVLSAATTATTVGLAIVITISTPPQATALSQHLGRVWANDKTNLDRLHYSETGNHEVWQGLGDSGALDIGVGDGDPVGIQAIFPTFNGQLFVAKQTKLYRITGYTPETFQVSLVSNSLGCVGPNAFAMEDDSDIYFMSDWGIHSLGTTIKFGDFETNFVSYDIQKSFNDDFTPSRRKYCWGAYLPETNSIAFAVTDGDTGVTTYNNAVWQYNVPLKSWYRWPNVPCQSLITVKDGDKRRLYVGGTTSRIGKTFNGANYDISTSGGHTSIPLDLETGLLDLDGEFYTLKGIKRFILYYRPKGTHTITVTLTLDNQQSQSLVYTLQDSSAELGVNFTLGVSQLGYTKTLAPFTQTVTGFGRGATVRIQQSGTDEQCEIQGFAIEYEPAGTLQETR